MSRPLCHAEIRYEQDVVYARQRARLLAEMLGGSVWVESRPWVGSTFFAAIPVKYPKPGDASTPEAAAAPDVTRHPVLVVEDDPATRLLYEKYLKKTGFQPLMAATVGHARQLLSSAKPLAIVLDILMAEGDAWGFLAEIKTAEPTRAIPVLVVSVIEEQDKAITLGAEDYCVKPVERRWLLNKLGALSRRMPVEKVLVIDDEEVARYILKGHLAETKYTVVEAADGPSGLRMAGTEQPGVIFLDLMMPGMSGFEVLHRLKENPSTRDIPVVISTSRILDEEERTALNEQAAAILSKEAPSREAAMGSITDALRKAVESPKGGGGNPNG